MGCTLNRVDLIGTLGRDPEVRTFPNSGKATSLSLATSERWKDRQIGEVREKTEWHRVEVKNDFLADLAAGKQTAPTFRDALVTQAVCDAVLDSAEHKKWETVVPV